MLRRFPLACLLVLALALATTGPVRAMNLEQKISLDFRDADIRDVLKIIAQRAGANFVVEKSVRGNVTVRLDDVPSREALDLVLRANGFSWIRSDNAILIADERKFSDNVKTMAVQHAEVDELAKIVSLSLRKNLKLAVDRDRGLLTVAGAPETVHRAQTLVDRHDTPLPVVRATLVVRRGDDVLRRLVVTGPVGREVKLAAKDHPPRGPAGEPTGPAPFIELGLTPLALTPDGAFRAYVHCTYGMPCGRDGTWADHRLEQTVNGRAGKAITLAEFGEPSRLSVQLTVEPGKGGER